MTSEKRLSCILSWSDSEMWLPEPDPPLLVGERVIAFSVYEDGEWRPLETTVESVRQVGFIGNSAVFDDRVPERVCYGATLVWRDRDGKRYDVWAPQGKCRRVKPTRQQTTRVWQMIEQLKWTAESVCSTYHVSPYKIGVGAQPTYSNVQSLNVEYYSQCLQSLLEDAESCMDDGLA